MDMNGKIIKFRLSQDAVLCSGGFGDFEYTAHINDECAIVSWIEEDGKVKKIPYTNEEVEENFKETNWVKI